VPPSSMMLVVRGDRGEVGAEGAWRSSELFRDRGGEQ
jgi:hypothetical protein